MMQNGIYVAMKLYHIQKCIVASPWFLEKTKEQYIPQGQ